jgi:hypothetical protein
MNSVGQLAACFVPRLSLIQVEMSGNISVHFLSAPIPFFNSQLRMFDQLTD